MRAVITFPGGWLLLEEQEEDGMEQEEELSSRAGELSSLREVVLPRTVTLLHSLLHSTGQFSRAVSLVDTVAEEGHSLYQAYSPEALQDLLAKVRESSLASMEQGRDAWGYKKQ